MKQSRTLDHAELIGAIEARVAGCLTKHKDRERRTTRGQLRKNPTRVRCFEAVEGLCLELIFQNAVTMEFVSIKVVFTKDRSFEDNELRMLGFSVGHEEPTHRSTSTQKKNS